MFCITRQVSQIIVMLSMSWIELPSLGKGYSLTVLQRRWPETFLLIMAITGFCFCFLLTSDNSQSTYDLQNPS